MEFPVYVASDCYGQKINVALRFRAPSDTLVDLFAAAQHAFSLFTVHHVNAEPLPPFAFAYLYHDVHCQWELLQHADQLAPCCQVYIFRYGIEEVIDAIPEPINLVLQAPHRIASSGRETTPPTPVQRSLQWQRQRQPAAASPPQLTSSRWVLPNEEGSRAVDDSGVTSREADTTFRNRTDDSTMKDEAEQGSIIQQRGTRTYHGASPGWDDTNISALSASTFGPVRSHRFRLQLLSPPQETSFHESSMASQKRDYNFASFTFPASQRSHRSTENTRTYSSPLSAALPAAQQTRLPATERAVAIPRSWYTPGPKSANFRHTNSIQNSSLFESPVHSSPSSISRYGSSSRFDNEHRHPPSWTPSAASTHTATHSRQPSLLPAPQVILSPLSTQEKVKHHPLGAPPLHPSSYGKTARARRGSSILREERERVEARMHMDLDTLRATLSAEDRGYERTRSASLTFPR